MDLVTLLSSRLEGFKRNGDGTFTARCPACAAEGHDKQKNHLRIWGSGAFRCSKYAKDSPTADPIDHNRAIRAFLYDGASPEDLAEFNTQIIDPEPKLEVDKVYPEEMLAKLIPDYRYWVGRGISEDVLRQMGGGLAPPDERNKLSGRYILPIRDDKGRIVGFTARLVGDASFGPKWKHLVKASKCVFPIHVANEPIRRARKVVLVESPGDYLSLASKGLPNALVLLGLNLNARVLGYLASINPTHIVISTNSDTERVHPETGKITRPGQDAAEKIRARLIPFFGEDRVLVRLPERTKDWNESITKGTGEVEEFVKWVEAL